MLVVLPFGNLSNDPEQEYFRDGLTEDITTALARIPGFLVTARNSAFQYKGKAVDPKQITKDLGVRYMLEGSVRKQGDRLRLNAQLIDTATGAHVWAEKYDRPFADVFAVQDELADKIVGTVASHLRRREGEKALAAPPEKLEAYELTMRARVLRSTSGRDESLEARRLLLQAIERDPTYALAHGMLGLTENYFLVNRVNEDYAALATVERMMAATSKGITLAPNDALVAVYHGYSLRASRQYEASEAFAERAVSLAPNDPAVLASVATVLLASGRNERVVELVGRTRSLDPFIVPASIGVVLATAQFLLGRYQEAEPLSPKSFLPSS